MIEIVDKSKCCGCEACRSICPKKCISMQADKEGFLYPKVDLSQCVDCKLCENVCPVLNPKYSKKEPLAYAGINNDINIRLQSSSGGIFTLIAEQVILKKGVVFGACFDEPKNPQQKVLQANFAVRCPICRFSCLFSCCKVWLLRSSPLPRQALEGLYAVVNPNIRIFSRQ